MDDIEYKAERGAYERIGIVRESDVSRVVISTRDAYGKKSINYSELVRRIARIGLNDNERFKMLLGILYDEVKPHLKIGKADVDSVAMLGSKIEKIGTKNPLASLLGYFVKGKNGTTSLDKDKVNEVAKYLEKEKVKICTIEDVVRYGIMWNNI